jgi:membrane-associated phospholipid phosphatase
MGLAEKLEKIFFPSHILLLGGFLLLLVLFHREVKTFSNDLSILIFLAIFYKISKEFLQKKIRDENLLYFLVGLLTLFLFFLCSLSIPLARELLLGASSLLLLLLFIYPLRSKWRISAHSATVAGTFTALTLIFPLFMAGFILLPLTGWSRVKTKAHNFYQVYAGAILGFLIPSIVFIFL